MPERLPLLLPLTIVIAGAIIGIAIYFVRVNSDLPPPDGDISLLRPVTPEDHTVGNPEADVVIVEYSDIDCEYCKQYQEVLAQLLTEYGPTGNVLWVYRHFPLIEVHPNAALHAEAAECAASVGGEQAFFRFIDAIQQAAPGSEQFDPKDYDDAATSIGIPVPAFTECINGSTFEQRVANDFDNAIDIGANGTPYALILIKGGETIPVSGALPYDAMKEVIEHALAKVQN